MRPPSLAAGYLALFPVLTEVAREKGYALGVHGSLARDMDLIAVPWIDAACGPEELVAALFEACKWAAPYEGPNGPVAKPHGRLGWVIALNGGAYLDLSVMPKAPDRPVPPPVPKPEDTP